MKLFYYRGTAPNFGDELNSFMWNKILPRDFLDEDERELFLGIGSILYDHHPKQAMKHIVGSGYGGYSGVPDVHDGSWNPVFVRGPRTARILGLPADKAVGDSAILLRTLDLPKPIAGGVAFMPHFESLPRGNWAEACLLAGMRFLDPRENVERLLAEIRGAKLLITEAMHGAIVADVVRTPWIATRPIQSKNRMKWFDWAEALGVDLRMHPLMPTSVLETYLTVTRTSKRHGPRAYQLNESRLVRPVNAALTHAAAARLVALTKTEPQLSADTNITSAVDRAKSLLDGFVVRRKKVGPLV
jgi:succinoglycan biosynthesis protein ExoV